MSPADIRSIAALVKAHHTGLAVELFGADALAPETLAEAMNLGLLTPAQVSASGALAGAFESGVKKLRPRPLTAWETLRAQAARQLGASMVVGLGDQVANSLASSVMSAGNEAVDSDRRRLVAAAVGYGVERHLSTAQIRSVIARVLGDDWARDVGRIAATEVQRAVNAGYAAAVATDFGAGASVAVIPNADACDKCRRAYLDGGIPRVFRLSDLPAPEVNFGVAAADRVVTLPPLHPWCHCQLIHVPEGWGFGDDWSLRP
ncbi:MAG: hypothetical protein EKK55_12245 [Rhodocyclaceae bacterium]|nr:MAG: hypothetical protein EKK55_12245 [Rhodocyclaceae bacterium]